MGMEGVFWGENRKVGRDEIVEVYVGRGMGMRREGG
jgi:hypothetical protein